MLIAYYVTLALCILFSFFPEYRVWGFNWWAFYPFWLKIVLVLVGAVMPLLIIRLPQFDTGGTTKAPENRSSRYWVRVGLLIALFAVLFVVLRARTHFLGDGYLLLGILADGNVLGRAWTAVGDRLHLLIHDMASGSPQERALFTYQSISYASGVGTLVVFAALARYLVDGVLRRLLVFGSLATGGYTLLFFGYVENYPPFAFAVALYLFVALLVARQRLPVYWLVVPLALAFLAHIFAVALLAPTILLFLYRSPISRWWETVARRTRRLLFILTCGAAAVFIFVLYSNVLFVRYALVPIVPNEVTIDHYTFFSPQHLLDFVNLLFVLAPGLLVVIGSLFRRRSWSDDLYARTVLLTAAVTLVMALIFNPNLGMARDWDLFAFAGIPLVLSLTLLLVKHQAWTPLGLSITLALLVLLPRVGAQATPEIGIAHFRNYANLNPLMNRTGRFALRQYYKKIGDTASAQATEAEFVRVYPAFRLQEQADSMLDRGDARGAAATARRAIALDGRMFDAHVILARSSLMLGDLAGAERAARIANAINPHTAMGLHVLGAVQCAKGEFEPGLKNMYQAREILDTLGQITGDIAQVLLSRGDVAGAMVESRRLHDDPTVPAEQFAGLAVSLQALGQPEAARSSWQEAVRRGLDSLTAARYLAEFPGLRTVADPR